MTPLLSSPVWPGQLPCIEETFDAIQITFQPTLCLVYSIVLIEAARAEIQTNEAYAIMWELGLAEERKRNTTCSTTLSQ